MARNIIFPTIPDVQANIGSMLAAILALRQCVNLLIIDIQGIDTPSNLQGAHVVTPRVTTTQQAPGVALQNNKLLQQQVRELTLRVNQLESRLQQP